MNPTSSALGRLLCAVFVVPLPTTVCQPSFAIIAFGQCNKLIGCLCTPTYAALSRRVFVSFFLYPSVDMSMLMFLSTHRVTNAQITHNYRGAFGAPWITLRMSDNDGEDAEETEDSKSNATWESFFGCDRFDVLAKTMRRPWLGPRPEDSKL